MEQSDYDIVNLPKLGSDEYSEEDDVAKIFALKLRELRLHALKTSPQAFATSYEQERQNELIATMDRLADRKTDHFFATDRSIDPWSEETNEQFFEQLFDAEWVGMIVLIGPLSPNQSAAISAKEEPLAGGKGRESPESSKKDLPGVVHFHLNGVFVDPAVRGAGLGLALVEAALAKAVAKSGGREIQCSVLVDSENLAARKLYQRAGFDEVGQETYTPQPRSETAGAQAQEMVAVKMIWYGDHEP